MNIAASLSNETMLQDRMMDEREGLVANKCPFCSHYIFAAEYSTLRERAGLCDDPYAPVVVAEDFVCHRFDRRVVKHKPGPMSKQQREALCRNDDIMRRNSRGVC
jgi:hypothetical protein